MSKEIPLQHHMFSDALVDTRSRAQRSRDRESDQPQQVSMFSVRETVQYGVNARHWLNDMAAPTLTLEIQDVRTEEEKERDRRRMAEALTTPMFTGIDNVPEAEESDAPHLEEKNAELPMIDKPANLRHVGFRAYVRRSHISVRRKGESCTDINNIKLSA